MSKTKKIKQKTTGFYIFYRVITVIMTVAMYPLFYYKNLLYFQIDHTSISNLINMFANKSELQITFDIFPLPAFPNGLKQLSHT